MELSSLSMLASMIPENYKRFSEAFPILSASAEAVYQGFEGLFTQFLHLDREDISRRAILTMGFGAQSSWVESYILSSAGHLSSSLADLRRAIEFSCYATKASTKHKRAVDWMNQAKDKEARKRFASSCSIPLCYEGEQYRSLRPLIVMYELANYYGAHGNLQTLVERVNEDSDGIEFSFQASDEITRRNSFGVLLTGHRILHVFTDIFRPLIKELTKFEQIISYADQQVRDTKLGMASIDYKGTIPDEIYRAIWTDENPSIDLEFQQIIDDAKERKGK